MFAQFLKHFSFLALSLGFGFIGSWLPYQNGAWWILNELQMHNVSSIFWCIKTRNAIRSFFGVSLDLYLSLNFLEIHKKKILAKSHEWFMSWQNVSPHGYVLKKSSRERTTATNQIDSIELICDLNLFILNLFFSYFFSQQLLTTEVGEVADDVKIHDDTRSATKCYIMQIKAVVFNDPWILRYEKYEKSLTHTHPFSIHKLNFHLCSCCFYWQKFTKSVLNMSPPNKSVSQTLRTLTHVNLQK